MQLQLARKSREIPQGEVLKFENLDLLRNPMVPGWIGTLFQVVWLHGREGIHNEQWYYPTQAIDGMQYIMKWIPEEIFVDTEINIYRRLKGVLSLMYLPSMVTKDIRGTLPQGHTYAMHNTGPFLEHLTDCYPSRDDMILEIEEAMVLLMHALKIATTLANAGFEMRQRTVFCVMGSSMHIRPVLVQFSGIIPGLNALRQNLLSVMDVTLWNFSTVQSEDENTSILAEEMNNALEEHLEMLADPAVDSMACVGSLQERIKNVLRERSVSAHKLSYQSALERLG